MSIHTYHDRTDGMGYDEIPESLNSLIAVEAQVDRGVGRLGPGRDHLDGQWGTSDATDNCTECGAEILQHRQDYELRRVYALRTSTIHDQSGVLLAHLCNTMSTC